LGQGVAIGALAGVWSGLINFILGLISAAGIATIISAVDQVIPAETLDLQGNFIGQMAILINVFLVFFNIFLGTIGGLVGGAIFQTKPEESMPSEEILPSPQGEAAELIPEEAGVDDEEQGQQSEQKTEENPGKTEEEQQPPAEAS
jgi:hypothetical protein